MSDSESVSDIESNDSEFNFIPEETRNIPNYEEEVEDPTANSEQQEDELAAQTATFGPYSDEPLADEAWIAEYNKRKEMEDNLRSQLQQRIDGVVSRETWCKCGNCRVETLQNVYEAKCCQEIERCVLALEREDVLADTDGEAPRCITLHPGFRPNCLEKWALKHSASKYKTRDQRRYKQKGTEEKFFRAVAYREFSQLVHGFLGGERVPLPACGYHAIRKTFNSEEFTGYQEED